MLPWFDAAQVRERNDKPDRAVATHAEITNIVEEDNARGARVIVRFANQRADEHFGAAWFVDDGGAKIVVLLAEDPEPVGQAAGTEVRPSTDDDARRFAGGVGIDDL